MKLSILNWLYRQLRVADCGVEAIRYLCRYFGLKVPSARYVRRLTRTTNEGTEIQNLVAALQHLGVSAKEGIAEKRLSERLSHPLVTLILRGGVFHFLVVIFVSPQNVRFFDPRDGELHWLPRREFNAVFTGDLIEVFGPTKITQGRYPADPNPFAMLANFLRSEWWQLSICVALSALDFLSVIGGVVFLKAFFRTIPNVSVNFGSLIILLALFLLVVESAYQEFKLGIIEGYNAILKRRITIAICQHEKLEEDFDWEAALEGVFGFSNSFGKLMDSILKLPTFFAVTTIVFCMCWQLGLYAILVFVGVVAFSTTVYGNAKLQQQDRDDCAGSLRESYRSFAEKPSSQKLLEELNGEIDAEIGCREKQFSFHPLMGSASNVISKLNLVVLVMLVTSVNGGQGTSDLLLFVVLMGLLLSHSFQIGSMPSTFGDLMYHTRELVDWLYEDHISC